MYFSVLGMLHTQKTAKPTKAHATVHTALSLRLFKQMVHVWMWLPMTKIWKMTWPQPNTSWNRGPMPTDSPMIWTASPKLRTKGYFFRNSPRTRPE